MEQVYRYSSSFTDDNYTILLQKTFFSKLQKTSWAGSAVDAKIDGRLYHVSKEELLKPFIRVLEIIRERDRQDPAAHTTLFAQAARHDHLHRWTNLHLDNQGLDQAPMATVQ